MTNERINVFNVIRIKNQVKWRCNCRVYVLCVHARCTVYSDRTRNELFFKLLKILIKLSWEKNRSRSVHRLYFFLVVFRPSVVIVETQYYTESVDVIVITHFIITRCFVLFLPIIWHYMAVYLHTLARTHAHFIWPWERVKSIYFRCVSNQWISNLDFETLVYFMLL